MGLYTSRRPRPWGFQGHRRERRCFSHGRGCGVTERGLGRKVLSRPGAYFSTFSTVGFLTSLGSPPRQPGVLLYSSIISRRCILVLTSCVVRIECGASCRLASLPVRQSVCFVAAVCGAFFGMRCVEPLCPLTLVVCAPCSYLAFSVCHNIVPRDPKAPAIQLLIPRLCSTRTACACLCRRGCGVA